MSVVGTISKSIVNLLGIAEPADLNIYLGQSNINHMKTSHPADFAKYGSDIPLILSNPDYVGTNPSDGSIEYVKEYIVDGEYVKVAVRLANSGKYYARSLYVLNSNRTKNYIAKGTLKKT